MTPEDEHESIVAAVDAGIAGAVHLLRSNGVETYESCQGGPSHCYEVPSVRFHGNRGAGWHAMNIALTHALPVAELHRIWVVIDGEPTGPKWQMTFARHVPLAVR